jgi:hypothetical protein
MWAGMTELPLTSSSLMSSGSVSGMEAARLEAEAALHLENRRKAVRAIAGSCIDSADCRTLLDMLGLGADDIRSAMTVAPAPVPAPTSGGSTRKRRRTAA